MKLPSAEYRAMQSCGSAATCSGNTLEDTPAETDDAVDDPFDPRNADVNEEGGAVELADDEATSASLYTSSSAKSEV